MSAELLRVSLSAEQVKDACAQWARERSAMTVTGVSIARVLITADVTAEVVFTQRRVRKTKGATA